MRFSFLCKRLVLPAFFYALTLSSCDSNSKLSVITISGPTMGTSYNVKIVDEGQGFREEDIKSWVDHALVEINQVFSTYIVDSELSKLNQAPVAVELSLSPSLCFLLDINLEISAITGGRYDPTIGPLVNLWGFGPDDHKGIPNDADLADARQRVGFEALELDCEKGTFSKAKNVYTDLSASAKGHGADVLAKLLSEKGISRAMIEIGGELRLLGTNATDEAWKIAVEKPSLGRTGAVQVIQVKDVAVATSGDYRNYYEVDGKRVSHTIDPLTAAPIEHKLASVTVVMPTGAEADAWATAFNVLGPKQGYQLAVQQNIAAYFIIGAADTFTVEYTPEFEPYMVNK